MKLSHLFLTPLQLPTTVHERRRRHFARALGRATALALVAIGSTACPGLPGGVDDTQGSTGSPGDPLDDAGPGGSGPVQTTTSAESDTSTSADPGSTSLTTGETATSTSTSTSASASTDTGGDTDGETDTDTGVDPDPDPVSGSCADACNTGCEDVLVATMQGQTRLWHAPNARLALDQTGRAVLWAAPADLVISTFEDVDAADLVAGVLAVETLGIVSVRAAADATELGVIDVTGAQWGLARDGSYVWVADGVSLRIFELDGTLRWEQLGDYADADVLPLPAALHVHATASGPEVQHIDAATALVTTSPFVGTFGGWFYDLPRFWSVQGGAYRLYETDGTQLAFAVGTVRHGYGDWLVLGSWDVTVVSVSDVATTVMQVFSPLIDGAGILNAEWWNPVLVRLDQPVLVEQPVVMTCCASYTDPLAFAFEAGHWMVSGDAGEVYDEQNDPLAPGELAYVHGAAVGRVGVTTTIGVAAFWDVSPSCVLTEQGSFTRPNRPGLLSGNGATLLAVANHPQLSIDLYDVATGVVFDTTVYGLGTSDHRGMQVSDAAELFGLRSINSGFSMSRVLGYPGWNQWLSGAWSQTPAVSPNGLLAVHNDAVSIVVGATFEGSLSYVHDATGLVALFDGVTHGFVDDTTLLVAHYVYTGPPFSCSQPGECDDFVSAEIVDTLGIPIAASPIPDPHDFQRVSSTEVFLPTPPAIYEIYTGALLWSGASGPAAAVGPDHVAHVVDGDLVLTKWR